MKTGKHFELDDIKNLCDCTKAVLKRKCFQLLLHIKDKMLNIRETNYFIQELEKRTGK